MGSALTLFTKSCAQPIAATAAATHMCGNWDHACANVRHHRWKNLNALAHSIGELNHAQSDREPLRETLILLYRPARLSSDASANRGEMPPAFHTPPSRLILYEARRRLPRGRVD